MIRASRILASTVALVLAGCGASSATGPATKTVAQSGQLAPAVVSTSLMLDWQPNSDHGGIYSAIQRGYFAQRGISPQIRVPSDSTAPIPLVAAGKVDFGIAYESELLAARARGLPVQAVMCIMQHPLNTVMTLQTSGITRPRQLAGKTIGVAGSPSDMPVLSTVMQHDGASIKSAHVVNVGYSLVPALLQRRVDAVEGVYWTWEALQVEAQKHAVNIMRVERYGFPNYCELVLIANPRTISNRPALVRGTVQALQAGYAYAVAHPVAAWQALHAQDRTLNRNLVVQSIRLLAPVVTGAPTVGAFNGPQWQRYANWLAAHKLITRHVNALTAFTGKFLKPGVH